MAKLADAQIALVALKAGFKDNEVAIATAISIAESDGNPRAHNDNAATGDDSYGLWQINMIGTIGLERKKQFNLSSYEQLYDPATNARVAYALYKRRGSWRDWSVFNNGKYLLYLPRGYTAAKAAEIGVGVIEPVQDAVSDARSTVQSAERLIAFVTNKDNWLRVAMFGGGALLVWVAVLAYVKNTQAVKTAVEVGKNFIPVGRAAKGVGKGAVGNV